MIEAARHLPQTVVALIRAGVSAVDLGRVLALATDTAVTRLMELAVAEEGEAPVPWAWMALGSVARREQALTSDQDNAMAYAPPADPEVDAYFEAVATRVNDQLTACGFGPDNAGVLARNREWRMSADEWTNVFEVCLEQPDHSHLIRAAVSFDFRSVVGALDIVAPLVAVERRAPAYPGFLRRLARTATDFPTPLGRRNRISTDKDGAFDIKKQGVVPIANLARFHALSVGGTVSPTLDRLATAAQGGAISEGTHAALAEAFELVVRMRLEHQAEQVERGEVPDDRIHPDRLTPLTRATAGPGLPGCVSRAEAARPVRPARDLENLRGPHAHRPAYAGRKTDAVQPLYNRPGCVVHCSRQLSPALRKGTCMATPETGAPDYEGGGLSRETNWWGAFVIGLAGTILVTGIAPVMVTSLGAASMPLIVFITITGYLLCLLLAELSAMMPERTGGSPSYAYVAYKDKWPRAAKHINGATAWMYWLGWFPVAPLNMILASFYLVDKFGLSQKGFTPIQTLDRVLDGGDLGGRASSSCSSPRTWASGWARYSRPCSGCSR